MGQRVLPDGRVIWVPDFGAPSPFSENTPPGAAYAAPEPAAAAAAEQADVASAQALDAASKDTQAATQAVGQEQTEEQKAQEQAEKDQVAAQQAALDAKKAAINAAEAAKKVGGAIAGGAQAAGGLLPEQEAVAGAEQPQDPYADPATQYDDVGGPLDAVAEKIAAPGIEAAESQYAAGEAMTDLEIEEARDQYRMNQEKGFMLGQEADRQREEQRQAVEAERTARAKIDTQIQKYMTQKVEKPSPSVLNVIGAALGGLLIPTLGRNPALEIINKRIEREVQIDMDNRRQALQGLQFQRSNLKDSQAEEI